MEELFLVCVEDIIITLNDMVIQFTRQILKEPLELNYDIS